jgi:hypothetical protein
MTDRPSYDHLQDELHRDHNRHRSHQEQHRSMDGTSRRSQRLSSHSHNHEPQQRPPHTKHYSELVYDPNQHRSSYDSSIDTVVRRQQEVIDQIARNKRREELQRQQEQKHRLIQQHEHRFKLLSQQQQQDPFLSDQRSLDSFSQNSRTSIGGGGQQQQQQQRHRKSLHRKPPSLSQYQTTPITKHYEIAKQILLAFDSHWNNHLWVTAYAVGLQFVETVLLEIPKHGYFYSSRHERERMESSLEAARVAQQLKELLEQQQKQKQYPDTTHKERAESGSDEDKYFIEEEDAGLVPNGDLQRVQKLLTLALEQVQQASTDQDRRSQAAAYESSRRLAEEELRYSEETAPTTHATTTSDWLLCKPLASVCCSDSFSNLVMGPIRSTTVYSTGFAVPLSPSATTTTTALQAQAPLSPNSDYSRVSERYSLASMESNSITRVGTHASTATYTDRMPLVKEQEESSFYLPSHTPEEPEAPYFRTDSSKFLAGPPLLGQRSSFAESGNRSDSLLVEKALFLSGLEVSDPYRDEYGPDDEIRDGQISTTKRDTHSSARLELNTLANLYHEDFDSLQSSRRVRISFVDTFQGRVRGSTNGCTVIAPLLCMHHLMNDEKDYPYSTGGDPGLPDSVIKHCIDVETPAVLNQLRSKLGLSETAFLIPSDAHDYLIQHEQLSQAQFKNVIGGNILDGNHLSQFISNLEKSDDKKIAATLFFHEHVVAILKLNRMDTQKRKFSWYDFIDSLPLKDTLRRQNETSCDLCERLNLFKGLSDEEIVLENEMAAVPLTARIRCLDAEALSAVIQWYACSKFTDENTAYIDQYPWNDANCDFDPRVFQAFLWQAVS